MYCAKEDIVRCFPAEYRLRVIYLLFGCKMHPIEPLCKFVCISVCIPLAFLPFSKKIFYLKILDFTFRLRKK